VPAQARSQICRPWASEQERRRTVRRAADRGDTASASSRRDRTDRLFVEFGHRHTARSYDLWMTMLAVVIGLAFVTWGAWSAETAMSARLQAVFATSLGQSK
jgi:hypothetical protein